MKKIHASAVSINRSAVIIRGPSGAGKSDLTLRLISEGAQLISDDYVELQSLNGRIWAHAPSTIAGLMEVRGLGIVKHHNISGIPVCLLCDLMPAEKTERLPDPPFFEIIDGVHLPLMQLDPTSASAVARIRLALDRLDQIWPSVLNKEDP